MVEVVERPRGARDSGSNVAATALGISRARTRAKLDQLLGPVQLRAGERLFSTGDPGDALYVVESGRLRAFADTGSGESRIGEIGRGELVGELALLDGEPRNASVYAVRDSVLLRLDRSDYEELLRLDPAVAAQVAAMALRRLRNGVRRRWSAPTCFAFVPLGPHARGTIEALVDQWGAGARIVTSDDTDRDVSALEEQHSHLAFVVETEWSAWTERSLRSADRVVLVAEAGDPPRPGQLEERLWQFLDDAHEPDVHLLLVHPAGTAMPSGTRAWLDVRDLAGHLHLRRGDRASLERSARVLAGTGHAVVFGGGGARGAGHLGVMDVLEDLGRPVDIVGGTSMGALVATAYGLELSREDRRRLGREAFRGIFDYTLPIASVLAGARVTHRLREVFADLDIADLWVPYFCVSTNLTRNRPQVHDRGPVVQALRASISVPGVFPPVSYGGDLLVDGGVLDNVPAAEMRRRNPTGEVIAIDVAPASGPSARTDYGLSVGGLHAWVARRRGAGPPRLLTTLVRSTVVASARAREHTVADGVADIYVDLETAGGGMLDFKQGDQIADDAAERVRRVLGPALAEGVSGLVKVESPRSRRTPEAKSGRFGGVMMLTIRDLQLRAVRVISAVAATSVVLGLLFLMTGLVEQFHQEPRRTVASLGAQGWMVPAGSTGAFTSAATLSEGLQERVPGAKAVMTARQVITSGGTPVDIVLIGYSAGSAPELLDGRTPARRGEIILDTSAGYEIGDKVTIAGREYTVAGRTDGSSLFAGMPVASLPLRQVQNLVFKGQRLASALLLEDASVPTPKGVQVLTPEEVALDARRPLDNAINSINLVRVLLWFVAAMIMGTLVYLSALDRRRDVAVLKAVGGGTTQLGASIALQGVLVALLASLVATVLQLVLVPVFPLEVIVPDRAFWQLPLLAVVVAVVAGAAGLRQAVRTDPALAFSGPGQ